MSVNNILNTLVSPAGLSQLLENSFFVANNISNFETLRPDLASLINLNGTMFNTPAFTLPAGTPPAAAPATPSTFDKDDPVDVQVRNQYRAALGREPEQAGFDGWVNGRKNGLSANDLTKGFFNSAEFKSLNLSDEEKIARVYRSVLNREPDAAGQKGWVDALKGGKPLDQIIDEFYASPEHQQQEAIVGKMLADNGGKIPAGVDGTGPLSINPVNPTPPTPVNGIINNPLAGLFGGGVAPTIPMFGSLDDYLKAQAATKPDDVKQQLGNNFYFMMRITGGFLPQFNPLKILGLQ